MYHKVCHMMYERSLLFRQGVCCLSVLLDQSKILERGEGEPVGHAGVGVACVSTNHIQSTPAVVASQDQPTAERGGQLACHLAPHSLLIHLSTDTPHRLVEGQEVG